MLACLPSAQVENTTAYFSEQHALGRHHDWKAQWSVTAELLRTGRVEFVPSVPSRVWSDDADGAAPRGAGRPPARRSATTEIDERWREQFGRVLGKTRRGVHIP